jgi:hypothetical protein
MMRERRRFRPATLEGLETRVVLNRGTVIAPVTVGKLTVTTHENTNQAVADQLNESFDSFTTDYLQAQGAYLANGSSQAAHTAFSHYVAQRVKLLAAQLTNIFAHVPGSLDRSPNSSPGGPVVVQTFLRTYINGPPPTSLLVSLEGRRSGSGAIPPPGTTGTTATLYTDQAISAIATARTIPEQRRIPRLPRLPEALLRGRAAHEVSAPILLAEKT